MIEAEPALDFNVYRLPPRRRYRRSFRCAVSGRVQPDAHEIVDRTEPNVDAVALVVSRTRVTREAGKQAMTVALLNSRRRSAPLDDNATRRMYFVTRESEVDRWGKGIGMSRW